ESHLTAAPPPPSKRESSVRAGRMARPTRALMASAPGREEEVPGRGRQWSQASPRRRGRAPYAAGPGRSGSAAGELAQLAGRRAPRRRQALDVPAGRARAGLVGALEEPEEGGPRVGG